MKAIFSLALRHVLAETETKDQDRSSFLFFPIYPFFSFIYFSSYPDPPLNMLGKCFIPEGHTPHWIFSKSLDLTEN